MSKTTNDFEIRVFTTEKGKKIYAFISLRDVREEGHTLEEMMREVARVKHDKIGTTYNYKVGYINRYKKGLDGLWFCSWYADNNYIPCIAMWKGKVSG